MGGLGSGRQWGYSGADCTDDYRAIDVRKLQHEGSFVPGGVLTWHWTRGGELTATLRVSLEAGWMLFSYAHRSRGGDWKSEEFPVRLDWTPCTYGGRRAWFLCPACRRRAAVLYGWDTFACRHCRRLAYPSQRQNAGDRAQRRAQNIRMGLGGTANMMEPFPSKPKGMRWRTYLRLKADHERLAVVSLTDIARRLRAVNGMVGRLQQKFRAKR